MEPTVYSLLIKLKAACCRPHNALVMTALGLCALAGCSSTSSSMGGQPGDNAKLKGNYTYTLNGRFLDLGDTPGFYQEAGTFIADGKGHLTGTDDLIQNGNPVTSPFTGTYAVESDGTGLMLLTIGSRQYQWAFSLTSNSQLTLIEFDSFACAAGGAFLQDTATLNSVPAGIFVFRTQAFQANNGVNTRLASIGRVNVSNGTIAGTEDIVRNGALSPSDLTGSLTAPDATGKGDITWTDNSGFSSTYFYYIIDTNNLVLLETDFDGIAGNNLGGGRALLQTDGPFDNSSLTNQFVFSGSGDTQNAFFGSVSVGALTSNGSGNITAGSYDAVVDGTPTINVSVTGTYNIAASGRIVLNLISQATGLLSEVGWIGSSSKIFYLLDSPGRTEGGTLYPQQTASISTTSLNSQFSFSMFGHDNQSPPLIDRVGVATFGGNSNFALANYFINRGGSRNQTSAPGVSYTLGANGRINASIPGISDNLVIYMVSNSSGYMILEDPNTQIAGTLAQQSSP